MALISSASEDNAQYILQPCYSCLCFAEDILSRPMTDGGVVLALLRSVSAASARAVWRCVLSTPCQDPMRLLSQPAM